jgi:hypothetical protein
MDMIGTVSIQKAGNKMSPPVSKTNYWQPGCFIWMVLSCCRRSFTQEATMKAAVQMHYPTPRAKLRGCAMLFKTHPYPQVSSDT